MDVIQLLPDSVANQIAAGEVIQRPASVIKELVENAIDAGARHIKVLVSDAGKSSIQVIDDGCGMSDTDARLSFERHATSKIRQAVDLFSLHTMGFRGEALASIAAVAQVTLETRREEDEVGTRVVLAGSRVLEQEVVSCAKGSNFLIENLFFNIPARRKFLKSNATEMSNITQAFERIALVYPEVEFSLYNNGTEVVRLGAANVHRRIIDIFGKRLNQQLLPIDTDTTLCKISGFVGKPEAAKKKGNLQYFFVNGRYMKHPYFHKAVMMAYDRLLHDGEQVSYFIYFNVNPEDIDVNIHPVKTEIKFENEQAIWQILMATVRNSIGTYSDSTSIDFNTQGKPDIPVFNASGNESVRPPQIDYNPDFNPFSDSAAGHKRSARGWEELFGSPAGRDTANLKPANLNPAGIAPAGIAPADFDLPLLAAAQDATALGEVSNEHYQLRGQYIVTQTSTGLLITDQHRASQRVLFEQYMNTLRNSRAHTQKLLFPEVVHFPPSYDVMLDGVLRELETLGFSISNLGGNSYSVEGVPSGLGGMDAVELVTDLVSSAMEQTSRAQDEVHTTLATALARKAATPYGELLSNDAMESLMQQLFQCSSQKYTADGKRISYLLSFEEIENKL